MKMKKDKDSHEIAREAEMAGAERNDLTPMYTYDGDGAGSKRLELH